MVQHHDTPSVLVVCGKNKRRSRTAEKLFCNDQRIRIFSAGLSEKSTRKLTLADIDKADLIIVMENEHKSRIRAMCRSKNTAPIEVLGIEDMYEYMDSELIELLISGINTLIKIHFDL
jgi:protein-tyrosine phosphatase